MNKRMKALIGRLEHKKNLKSSYHLSLPEIYLLLNQLLNSDKNVQECDAREAKSKDNTLVNNSFKEELDKAFPLNKDLGIYEYTANSVKRKAANWAYQYLTSKKTVK